VALTFTVEDDKLKIQITGWGGEQGYRALSSGQRRRVDVAVLLGLARIAGGAAGGLLVIDECFDGLDAEGAERVALLLGEEGQVRPVLVMSHDATLVRALPYCQWIYVREDSTLEVKVR
jgi:energy-coupling factor transporter ATP-binding protein EcfA2